MITSCVIGLTEDKKLRLSLTNGSTEYIFYHKAVEKKIGTMAHLEPRIRAFWLWLYFLDDLELIGSITISPDKMEYLGETVDISKTKKLNKAFEQISALTVDTEEIDEEDPQYLADLSTKIETEPKLEILQTRLEKEDFENPLKATIQYGKFKMSTVEWGKIVETTLNWKNSAIVTGLNHRFVDWEESQSVYFAEDEESKVCMRVFIGSDITGKLIPDTPDQAQIRTDTEVSDSKMPAKKTEMIAITDVANMLCELGLGLANHFDLDPDEVMEYLDSVCEDTVGADPKSAKVLEEAKEAVDEDDSSEEEEDEDSSEDEEEDSDDEDTVLEEEEEKPKTCKFILTTGPNKGKHCQAKPKDGDFCGKHKPKATKPSSSGQCLFVGVRGANKGKQCEIKPKNGQQFCAKHAKSVQVEKKNSKERKIKVVRNKSAKVWMIDGENLVVKNAENPIVYAFLTKKGEINKTLNKTAKSKAKELGLEIA